MSSSDRRNLSNGPSRQSSLKDFVTRRLGVRRPNLTRQHSIAGDDTDDPPERHQRQQFLSPQPLPRSQHLAPGHLVHQRSSESHDSSVSAASMASAASYGGRWGGGGDGGGGGEVRGSADGGSSGGAEGFSMDLLNLKRNDSDDEDNDDRKDEASIKGLWKRAFSSLKIRDKIKSPKKKKGSKDREDDIDPVYYLLKHAADKGTQRCPTCSQQQHQAAASSGACAAVSCGSSGSCPCHCHQRQGGVERSSRSGSSGGGSSQQRSTSMTSPPSTPVPSIRVVNDYRRPQPARRLPQQPQLTHQMSAPSSQKHPEVYGNVKGRKV